MHNHPAGDQHWTRAQPERIKRGAASHAAKLSAADIEAIRAILTAKPFINRSKLARAYGVSRITIWRIRKDM